MRRKITLRTLISILMHLLMGVAFLIVANLLIHTDFTITYLDDQVSYVPKNVFNEEYEFEDSSLYTEIYTHQLQDIISYCAIKNLFEKIESHSDDSVNILDFDYSGAFDSNTQKLVYNIDDLIKWGRSGFTYGTREYTVEEFMNYYDSPYTFDDILYHCDDNVYYYVNDAGQTIVSVKYIEMKYAPKEGEAELEKVATNWIQFYDIQNALKVAAEKYVKYYDLYRNGVGLYEISDSNVKYILRIGENNTYTNIKDSTFDVYKLADEELTEIISDYKDYIVYYPDKLEYSTFSNVKEADLYTFVRLYADEFNEPIKLWAYVKGDFNIANDALSTAYEATSGRKGITYRSVVLTASIAVVYLALLFLLVATAGVIKKGEYYTLFFDKIYIEIYLVFLIVAVLVVKYLFVKNYDFGIKNQHFLFMLFGFLISFFACTLLCSLIRRIRNKSYNNFSLFYCMYKWYGAIRDKVENHSNSYVAALIPFHFYFAINFLLFALIVISANRSNRVGVYIPLVIMIIVNVFFAIRAIKKAFDRNALKDGIKRISAGEVDYKIKTEELLPYNRPLAEDINHAGEAIKSAVNTSLKDEKMKSDLITNVSHDLKTPLTSIINYVNLLKDENITEEPAADYIKTLEEKSTRLKQLLIDLIDASRLSSGTTEVNYSDIRITELLHQIIAEFSDKLEEAGLSVVFDGETKANIRADGRHMWRLMDNLFENVCKYSLSGTRVYVAVREIKSDNNLSNADKILISIKNVSAAPNNLQGSELTERFIRGDASRSSEGSGLGLYIAKSLTELQNGTFEVIADGDLFRVDIVFDILR
ncbi:MAG: HAMP domain-containing histidine kinase [Lachnospiraceae bacterium]|nr:HAMP domain-containing histidine kinase [Lachnospiraceae bacterium]